MSEVSIPPSDEQPPKDSCTQDGHTEANITAEPVSAEFTWTIPISLDTSGESFLGNAQVPVPEDSSIPREIIAEEIRSTRFQAELVRPLRLGFHNGLPAYLLCFAFSFQRISSGARIREATITIRFDDAPTDTSADRSTVETGPL